MTEAPEQAASVPAVKVTADVRRRLLTIQYQRKMAGEILSLSDIIAELLAAQPVKP